MATQLKVTWEGNAPGLSEHRLSLGAFSQPLNLLVTALKRIATNKVSLATDDKATEKTTGRFADMARQVDIQVVDLVKGSSGIDAVCTFDPGLGGDAFLFIQDLIDETTVELLDSIDEESKGHIKNASIRNYLRSLPPGVNRQTYSLERNGTLRKRVVIGDMTLQSLPDDLPYLMRLIGNIVGVGFEPGKTEVRIKTDEISQAVLSATPKQVETALQLRRAIVDALTVKTKQSRLLRLQEIDAARAADGSVIGATVWPIARKKVTAEYIEKNIFQRWDTLLRRLAE